MDGTVPTDALNSIAENKGPVVPLRFEVDVTTPGPVRFGLNSVEGISEILIDGNRVAVAKAITADLASGRHAITLMVDTAKRNEDIQCELQDAPGSSAKAQAVLGR